MTNSNSYAENLGNRNIIIFVLTDLKSEIKEDIVFVMKAKTYALNVLSKQINSSFFNLMGAQKHPLFLFQR